MLTIWVKPTWEPIKKMRSTNLSFSQQIPESRNSVIGSDHFLCYSTLDNTVRILESGYHVAEFPILKSLINVFLE